MKTTGTTTVIGRTNFDAKVMYVGCRVPTAAIKANALGLVVPALPKLRTGYLFVTGNKPGLLVHTVRWDGKDVYQRGNVVGSLSALNSTSNPGYKAEIISGDVLLERAAKFGRVVKCQNVRSKKWHTVALLNSHGDLYVAGIEMHAQGGWAILNMEPVASYNKADVQYTGYTDVKVNIRKFLCL